MTYSNKEHQSLAPSSQTRETMSYSSNEQSIRVSFDNGARGIELRADGTSTTWGSYTPDADAAEFYRCVMLAMRTANPNGSA